MSNKYSLYLKFVFCQKKKKIQTNKQNRIQTHTQEHKVWEEVVNYWPLQKVSWLMKICG